MYKLIAVQLLILVGCKAYIYTRIRTVIRTMSVRKPRKALLLQAPLVCLLGSAQALLRLYSGSAQALLRLCPGSVRLIDKPISKPVTSHFQ